MAYMCVMSTSLYGGKECDGCGKCEHRYEDKWDYEDWRDDEYCDHCEDEE